MSPEQAQAAPVSTTRPRIGPRSAGRLMTPEEFDAVPESRWVAGYRYELINGVVVVSPPPSNAEQDPNQYLSYILLSYQENHPRGSSIDSTLPEQTVVTAAQRRRADRVIWSGLGRTPDPERDVPSIVVEFVSADRRDAVRDYETKRGEYLAVGIVEYWVVDRFRRTMTAYANTPAGAVARVVHEADSFETPLLPGFVLPLARLLGRADLWPRKKRRRRPPA